MKGKNRDIRKATSTASVRAEARPRMGEFRFWPHCAAGFAAVILVFWAYGPSLHGAFLFDDTVLPFALPSVAAPFSAWVQGVRPVLMATYWLNAHFGGEDPYSYHVLNVVFHIVTSGLVFLIVRRLLDWSATAEPQRDLLAAFAASIFLLHPIQTEAVAYLAGRSEAVSVMVLFMAYTVFLYRKERAIGWMTLLLVLALFGTALLSKEHTIVLPALLLLTDYWWNPGFSFRGIRGNWKLYGFLALGGVGGLAFFWRLIVHSSSAGFNLPDLPWYQYFFTQCRALFVYPAEFLFPVRLTADWDFPISRTIFDHGAVIGLVVLLTLVGAAWHYRRRFPLACFGFFVYLVLMAPTSSILPIKDPVAERRLYLSMLGLLLIVLDGVRHLKVDARKLAAALAMLVLAATCATRVRAAVWADPVALWQDTASKSPNKLRVRFQLASAYVDANRCDQAVVEYREAAGLAPPDYNLLVDWALAYDCLNQVEPALAKLREAAALEPTAHVYSQIALVHAKRSRWADALDALVSAEAIDPNYAWIYVYRGDIQTSIGQVGQAVENYRRALALDGTLEGIVRPKLGAAEARARVGR